MTGPKHLWSGDWERESTRPPDSVTHPVDADAQPELDADEPGVPRWWRRPQALVALGTGLAAAAVTVALVLTLGGTRPGGTLHQQPAATTASTPSAASPSAPASSSPATTHQQPTATPVLTGPSANWLGMQIVTSPQGVVVATVALGSPADRAGLEPGDVIEEVNRHQVDTLGQLTSDAHGIDLGKPVRIQVLRDSVLVQAAAMPMTERPTIHP